MNDMEEDKNYINLIRGDLTKASQAHNGMPDSVGMMNIKTANQTILEASLLPTPRALWDSFWYEGELSCLFADSNVGKSILAVQIADRIARTDNVLYLDFELSEKQFQLRYTNEHGELYTFPDKLYRVSIDCNQLLDANFEEAIIGGIEQMAVQTDCKIFIIDNLTYLCCAMEKGDAAGRLMIQLNNLKNEICALYPCPSTYAQTLFGLSQSHPTTLPEANGSTISLTACSPSGRVRRTEGFAM